jgi:hypothetical protein
MGLSKIFRRGDPADGYVRAADERALVRRLDTFLLTFGCLSQGRVASRFRSECPMEGLIIFSDQIS